MSAQQELGAHPTSSSTSTRRAVWPWWAVLAGVAGFTATISTDTRPAEEATTRAAGDLYTASAADMGSLNHFSLYLGGLLGLVTVVALLLFHACWRRRVEDRFSDSIAAALFSSGLIVSAAGLTLGYGWKYALGGYVGPEKVLFDDTGRYIYFILADFSPYIPWLGVLISALALCWMAWRERLVSRVLGTVVGILAAVVLAGVAVSGVAGLPGTAGHILLAIIGLWLGVGRSAIIRS